MADLASFAKGVVHDLRNPLNVVEMNLYLLRQRLGEDQRALRLLQRISDQVPAIEHLLHGYLAFDGAAHPTFQRVRINEVVKSVADTTIVPDGITFSTDLAEELPITDADPQLLDAVLRALLRNSFRAMRTGGKLVIRTRHEGDQVQLLVEDTGTGIAEELIPQVFQPFFSTWEEHAGVGLPLVAQVARAHGGQTYLNTTPGEGTQVVLELPVAARP